MIYMAFEKAAPIHAVPCFCLGLPQRHHMDALRRNDLSGEYWKEEGRLRQLDAEPDDDADRKRNELYFSEGGIYRIKQRRVSMLMLLIKLDIPPSRTHHPRDESRVDFRISTAGYRVAFTYILFRRY